MHFCIHEVHKVQRDFLMYTTKMCVYFILFCLSQEKPEGPGGIPLTGDPQVDADIMAFVRARQNILRQGKNNQCSWACTATFF